MTRSGWRLRPSSAIVFVGGSALIVTALWRLQASDWGAIVWMAGLLAMVIIRAPHQRMAQAEDITDNRRDTIESVLLGATFLTMMLLPLLHLATGAFDVADYTLPAELVAAGMVLQALYLWLFWRSHVDLGRNWSPTLELRQEHALITHGVYRRIRHPMYAAIWLGAFSQALLIQNWIAGFAVIPVFAAMYLIRMPREEAMMHDRFGAAYDEYAKRTGRVVPRLRMAFDNPA